MCVEGGVCIDDWCDRCQYVLRKRPVCSIIVLVALKFTSCKDCKCSASLLLSILPCHILICSLLSPAECSAR